MNNKGFTLVELIVVMGIFIIIMIITTYAFENILKTGGQQTKTAASQIEGIVGLEMLRTDLAHAGYGLPWEFQFAPDEYDEVDAAPDANIGVDAAVLDALNDSPPALPRAVVTATTGAGTTAGSQYLVIKSALLPLKSANSAVGRWGRVNYSSAGGVNTSSIALINDASTDLRDGTAAAPDNVQDRVVTIRSVFSNLGGERKILVMDGDGGNDHFSYSVPAGFQPPSDFFKAADEADTLVVYGISATANIRMPYNRADYYISRPPSNDPNFKIPDYCNSGTGVLFKAVTDQTGGYGTNIYPLLNCVGDMRVVYNLDMDDDGNPQTFSDATNGGNFSSSEGSVAATEANINATIADAALLRQRLKSVYVYLLSHEGKKDGGYSYPNNSVLVGDPSMATAGRTWTADEMSGRFGTNWRNYRWKVYSIQVNMRNLQ